MLPGSMSTAHQDLYSSRNMAGKREMSVGKRVLLCKVGEKRVECPWSTVKTNASGVMFDVPFLCLVPVLSHEREASFHGSKAVVK